MKKTKKSNSAFRISFIGTEYNDIDDLIPFQDNLKNLTAQNYEKLKADILRTGFGEPVSIWKNEGKKYLLNGHQRHRVMKKMREEGETIPKIPCNIIACKDKDEATDAMLSYASQFGDVIDDGLYQLQMNRNISFENLKDRYRFPEVDFNKYNNEYFIEALGSVLKPEFPIVPEFSESYDYIVILATNDLDYMNLTSILGIEKQQSYKGEKVGQGRVVMYSDFIKKIKKS